MNDLTRSSLRTIGFDFWFVHEGDSVTLYWKEKNIIIPDVSYCITIDQNLRVIQFYRSLPISLANWFREDRIIILNCFSTLPNFISHMKQVIEEQGKNLEELNNLRYSKATEYSPRLIRYALHLQYKFLLEELPLPS